MVGFGVVRLYEPIPNMTIEDVLRPKGCGHYSYIRMRFRRDASLGIP